VNESAIQERQSVKRKMKDIENEQMVSRTLDREQVIRRYSVEPCSVLIARMRKRK
jgi:hypothetical protein